LAWTMESYGLRFMVAIFIAEITTLVLYVLLYSTSVVISAMNIATMNRSP